MDHRKVFGDLIEERARLEPDRQFIRFESGGLTFAELRDLGRRLAAQLEEWGITKGDTVAVMLPNGREALVSWAGLAMRGIIEVPLQLSLRGESLAYQLRKTECRVLIVHSSVSDMVVALGDVFDQLEHVVVVGEIEGDLTVPCDDFDDCLERSEPRVQDVHVDPDDTSIILFTSGTTGPSKGVELTHAANFRLAIDAGTAMAYESSDVLFTAFPLAHVNARFTTTLNAILLGATVVMHRRFSASNFWNMCRAEGVTAFNYLGAVPVMLLKQPELADDPIHGVRKAYGAGADVETIRAFEGRFGVRMVELYGSTELGMVFSNTVTERKIDSCGRAMPYWEVALLDPAGHRVALGEPGEVAVRSKEPGIMFRGYYRDPEATVRAFTERWFHTGDRCRVDGEGYYYFVDRVKDVIRRRGENISSWEVERALETHPEIVEAAAIGVPSDLGDEEVLVVVVPRGDVDPAQLLDWVRDRLPHFAVPRFIRFAASLPRNASQRTEKSVLRSDGVTGDTWDREHHGYRVIR